MTTEAPREKILSLTQNFIKIPSVADNITALNEAVLQVEKLLSQFTKKSFISDGKPSLLIHNAPSHTKHFKIILNAHLDVVQANKQQFTPSIKDGRLYGRGAYDMKAAAAVIIILFKNMAKKLHYPIALQITTDEETGTLGAKKQVDEGYRSEFVLVGECGSNFMITNKAKGIYHIKITTKGAISHSAYPWRGDNAIVKLQKVLGIITEQFPLPRKEAYTTTVNITGIRTDNASWNRTPDHAEASFDIRYIPEDHTIIQKLKSILPDDVIIETLPDYSYSPIDIDPHNPYITLLQKTGKSVLKHDLSFRTAHATSDLVRFAAVGCEGVEFGPIGSNQHGDNEWVDIASLEDYYHILKQFLLSVK